MSYNIDHIETPVLDARMLASDVLALHIDLLCSMPDSNLLEEHLKDARAALAPLCCPHCRAPRDRDAAFCKRCGRRLSAESEPEVALRKLTWRGEGSGHTFDDVFRKVIIPKIRGRIDAVVTWAGGDSVTGFQVRDGQFIECDVVHTLVPKVSP